MAEMPNILIFKGKMVRPARVELATFWFVAKSNVFRKPTAVSSNIEKPAFTARIALCRGVAECIGLPVGSLQKSLQSPAESR
jgi:hypothetical protein